ncbi:MAG TPA: hypothetical protein VI636_10660, partial [Candidatus Angelobacter sp.]
QGQQEFPNLCQVERLEDASYVLVMTRSTFNTSSTVSVPHQQREQFNVTISTYYGDASLQGYATVTQYEIREQPVQCDVVSAYLYLKNSPYPAGYAQRVYTSGSRSFFAGLGAGLIAASGGSASLTACDLGSRKPVKDTAKAVLKFALLSPVQAGSSPSRITAATEFGGNYRGSWSSTRYRAGGAASMVMTISEHEVRAEISLTGGQVTRDTLYGKAAEDSGEWEVSLRSANGDVVANGIFKNGAFEGDYDYAPAGDHGRWTLKKD